MTFRGGPSLLDMSLIYTREAAKLQKEPLHMSSGQWKRMLVTHQEMLNLAPAPLQRCMDPSIANLGARVYP